MVLLKAMRKYPKEENTSENLISLGEFLKSYNLNMPASFPRVTTSILKKFKLAHPVLFKHGDLWSLDEHRKKIIDWMPLNTPPNPLS